NITFIYKLKMIELNIDDLTDEDINYQESILLTINSDKTYTNEKAELIYALLTRTNDINLNILEEDLCIFGSSIIWKIKKVVTNDLFTDEPKFSFTGRFGQFKEHIYLSFTGYFSDTEMSVKFKFGVKSIVTDKKLISRE